jgi:cytochrome oxidase Cu insertion factor (SCO1/SenC/PrrC family)
VAESSTAPATEAGLGARLAWLRQSGLDAETRVRLLAEQSPIYAGLGTLEAERLRANLFESFAAEGLPESGLPAVLEELSTGDNVISVAAAARSLLSSRLVPAQTDALLARAIEKFATHDVPFDVDPTDASTTTAVGVIVSTRLSLCRRPTAEPKLPSNGESCCSGLAPLEVVEPGLTTHSPRNVLAAWPTRMEDQYGRKTTFGEMFAGRPAFVTFFYTRCASAEKCSASIARMGRLQRSIKAVTSEDALLAALTYDPAFDIAPRLLCYGEDRGLDFNGSVCLLRTMGSFEPIREIFDLNVGFGETTVNRHSLEAFVLDRNANVVRAFRRRQWTEGEVFSALQQPAA